MNFTDLIKKHYKIILTVALMAVMVFLAAFGIYRLAGGGERRGMTAETKAVVADTRNLLGGKAGSAYSGGGRYGDKDDYTDFQDAYLNARFLVNRNDLLLEEIKDAYDRLEKSLEKFEESRLSGVNDANKELIEKAANSGALDDTDPENSTSGSAGRQVQELLDLPPGEGAGFDERDKYHGDLQNALAEYEAARAKEKDRLEARAALDGRMGIVYDDMATLDVEIDEEAAAALSAALAAAEGAFTQEEIDGARAALEAAYDAWRYARDYALAIARHSLNIMITAAQAALLDCDLRDSKWTALLIGYLDARDVIRETSIAAIRDAAAELDDLIKALTV